MSPDHGLVLAGLWLVCVAGCQRSPVCSFEPTASADGVTRVALIIGTGAHRNPALAPLEDVRNEVARVARVLADLDFPQGNVCVLGESQATLAASRMALEEFTGIDAAQTRFFYFTGYGSEVLDASADEPDERDETLLFHDADGAGGGELLDDELATWLDAIASGSESSLAVINGGYRARNAGDVLEARYWQGDLSRRIAVTRRGSDGAALLVAKSTAEHVVVARGTGGTANVFADQVASSLESAGGQSPNLTAFAARVGVEQRSLGLDPEIVGGGALPLFALARNANASGTADTKLFLLLRGAQQPGGIEPQTRAAIAAQLAPLAPAVKLADGAGAFELSSTPDGGFVLRGPDNRVRNRVEELTQLNGVLAGHLVQRRLMRLRGNGAPALQDYQSLRVSLRPAQIQRPCADGIWDQAHDGAVQTIPLCHRYYIQVQVQAGAPPLYVDAIVLSSDGNSHVLQRSAPLRVERSHAYEDQMFVAAPPLDVFEQVLVVGATKPIDVRALLTGATDLPADMRLTVGAVAYEVVANNGFVGSDALSAREYTIQNFDIRPYLPDDDTSALARFLKTADALAKASVADGYGYKQHAWDKASDADNLAFGIDCSRSIWYAFTRSGQTYNRSDRFLTTADMVTPGSWMADEFDHCPTDGSYVLGDVLVYRSAERGDGHVVAVIDPQDRVAWGSHGWDGTPKVEPALKPDTGVEYQKIKMKTDWVKWDRADMQLKACWRYRAFAQERANGRAAPGSSILSERCAC